jgi:hypothetical protein
MKAQKLAAVTMCAVALSLSPRALAQTGLATVAQQPLSQFVSPGQTVTITVELAQPPAAYLTNGVPASLFKVKFFKDGSLWADDSSASVTRNLNTAS